MASHPVDDLVLVMASVDRRAYDNAVIGTYVRFRGRIHVVHIDGEPTLTEDVSDSASDLRGVAVGGGVDEQRGGHGSLPLNA